MTKKEKYVLNLDEKIFFICFFKPSCPTEIAELVYGSESKKKDTSYSKVVVKTEKLTNEKVGWLEYLPDYKPTIKKGAKIDGRASRRKYYSSRSDPLIAKIQDIIKLTKFDIYVLKNIFNSQVFRESVCNSNQILNFILKDNILAPLDYILAQFEYFATVHLKNKYLSFLGKQIKNREAYDFITQGYKKIIEKQDIDSYKEKLKKLIPSMYDEMSDLKTSKDLYKKLGGIEYLMFVPSDLLEKIKGVSFLGLFDLIFQSINCEVKNMENNIRTFWPNVSSKIDNC